MREYWYLVKVLPGKERQLETQFNEEISMGRINHIKHFHCPIEKQIKVVAKKKKIIDKVIYTGYLYLEAEMLLDEDQLKYISILPGIMGILGDRKPVLLRESEVKKILQKGNDDVVTSSITYRKDESVRIIDGPFNTFEGIVSDVKDNKVDVEVRIFGRVTSVNLDINQIEKY